MPRSTEARLRKPEQQHIDDEWEHVIVWCPDEDSEITEANRPHCLTHSRLNGAECGFMWK
jgi:hypothetical protein